MKRDTQRPVAVEDLLRLKRAERPADNFWGEFDRQLRAKQLAALVEKRPWWRTLSLTAFLGVFRRFQLPLGATAILALSFVSYRASQTTVPLVVESPAGGELAPNLVLAGEVAASRQEPVSAPIPMPEALRTVPESVAFAPGAEAEFVASATEVSRVSVFSPVFGANREESTLASPSSASLSVDSGWSSGSVVEPVLSRSLLAATTRFEARTFPARPAVEPLKQITPPGERRGARILTAMVSMASVESAMRTTERAANRLSEEELYEQIRRVGAFGAGVNVKF